MGGFGSGRRGWRPVVEDGIALDIGYLRRSGRSGGSLHWSKRGCEVAAIGWWIDLEAKLLTLNYVAGEAREPVEQRIRLTTTAPHLGGVRWWMLCPYSGRRCLKLYSGWGFNRFASREALGIAYRSQREDQLDRLIRRTHKILDELGGTGDLDEAYYLPKPKWMRWPTYERKMAEALAGAEAFSAKAARIIGLDRF